MLSSILVDNKEKPALYNNGFKDCLNLFNIGFEKLGSYNAHIELKKLKKEYLTLEEKYSNLQKKHEDEYSLLLQRYNTKSEKHSNLVKECEKSQRKITNLKKRLEM